MRFPSGIPSLAFRGLVLAATLARAAVALAQTPATPPVVSPEVLPDGRVVFRVNAPKAAEVGLTGDWMPPKTLQPMTRDDRGVWSTTVGPLEPGLAIYTFTVDGVTTPDPVNPRVKLRARTSASLVDVPGNPPEPWQARDVPHGRVEIVWHRSAVTGDTRCFEVYVPPGYRDGSWKRYPALYLLHGSNDTAAGWTDVGKANFVLDALLAEKRAVPMIVVMPWGHAVPFDGPQTNNTALFERYLLDEVVPRVESGYRVARGRDRRAIVGLSMGGGQALEIGLGHLDRFATVGAFSSAVPRDFGEKFGPLLGDAAGTNAKLRLLWIACGRRDGAFERNEWLSRLLDDRHIAHTFRATDDLHNYAAWRRYLAELVPRLFRDGKGSP